MSNSYKNFVKGIAIIPKVTSENDTKGEIELLTSDNKLRFYNGTVNDPVVTETVAATLTNKSLSDTTTKIVDASDTTKVIKFDAAGTTGTTTTLLSSQTTDKTLTLPDATDTLVAKNTTDTLTNKTIDGDNNTVQDLAITALKTDLAAASTFISRDAAGIPISTKVVPTGTVLGTTDTQTLTNKSIDGSLNTLTNVPAGALPATVVYTTATQTLTNKTLTSPVINTPTGIVKGDVGLGNVDNTSDATKNAAVATLTNKTLTTPVISSISNTGTLTLPTSTDTLVGRATTDTLTNKTLTSPTINTPTLTGPISDVITLTDQGSTPASPAASKKKIYPKNDGKLYQLDSSGNETALGAGSGTKNYFQQSNINPDFESGVVTPWTPFTTTLSAGVPTTVTTTATQMAISVTSTTPLAGTKTMQLVKSAANAVGQGFISAALTIDREDLAKPLFGSFSYELVANSANFDGSGTSTQSLEIWIYNVTAGTWIQPSGFRGINQTTGPGKVTFSFQSDATAANNQYRVAVFTQQTATTGYTINFDDFVLGPQVFVLGMPGSDWRNDLTFTPMNFGTISNSNIWYRRVGDTIFVRGYFTSGTPTGSAAYLALPNSIDNTKNGSASSVAPLGHGYYLLTSAGTGLGSGNLEAAAFYDGTTTNKVYFATSAGTSAFVAAPGTSLAASGSVFSFSFSYPVIGWSSSVQFSSDTDTRVVALVANKVGGAVTASTAIPTWTNTIRDTHGSFNSTSGVYTVPISGEFPVTFIVGTTAGTALPLIYQNGVLKISGVVSGTSRGIASGILICKAGDTIHVAISSSLTLDSAAEDNYLSIHRLSGPSVVAASESVAAQYSLSANFAADLTIPINFDTRVFDSHNAVTTSASAWKFTAPISGVYQVETSLLATTSASFHVYRGGSGIRNLGYVDVSWNAMTQTCLVRLLAGEYIDVRPSGAKTITGGTAGPNNNAVISIHRVGNY